MERTSGMWALAAIVAGALSVGAPTLAATDLPEQVKAAKTAADHQALAREYEQRAADAKAEAARHRQMAESYKGAAETSSGKTQSPSTMPAHCEKLVKSFEEQAQMYTEMAATERELAKAAK